MSRNDLILRGEVEDILFDAYDGTIDEGALAYLISELKKIPAVPQEMSAREYEEAFHRIAYEDVETYRVWWEAIHDEDWGRAVAIVEKWAKEHPETDMMTAKYALPRIDFEERSEE